MLEIEMKFRVPDANEYERRLLRQLDASLSAPELETDVFFTNEPLGFPNEGKALRIRRRGDYIATTFKGPKLDKLTKTREEIELPLAPTTDPADVERTKEDWIRFYERLGFQQFGAVEKRRRRARATFRGREFELTLDAIDGLGTFAEIETTAPPEEFEAARSDVLALANALELKDSIVKSYLALTLEERTGEPIEEK